MKSASECPVRYTRNNTFLGYMFTCHDEREVLCVEVVESLISVLHYYYYYYYSTTTTTTNSTTTTRPGELRLRGRTRHVSALLRYRTTPSHYPRFVRVRMVSSHDYTRPSLGGATYNYKYAVCGDSLACARYLCIVTHNVGKCDVDCGLTCGPITLKRGMNGCACLSR